MMGRSSRSSLRFLTTVKEERAGLNRPARFFMALIKALTTLAAVKALSFTTGTDFDTLLERLINNVSAAIAMELDRELQLADFECKIAANNRQYLYLPQWPIVEITTITDYGSPLVVDVDYEMSDDDARLGRLYRESGWRGRLLVDGLTSDPVAAARDIEVTYSAGYLLPADTDYDEGEPDSLPLELQQVCDEIVLELFSRAKRQAYGLNSYSEGGISFNIDQRNSLFTPEQHRILAKYKRGVCA